eukprot:1720540-Rhodomonas_salina.1
MEESSLTGEQTQPELDRPFTDRLHNDIWRLFASQMIEGYDKLADVDILEPNPSNRNKAMLNVRLRPFWMDSENKEMAYWHYPHRGRAKSYGTGT